METASGTYDSENRSVEEMTRYLNGLKRYTEKGIPIYMDGKHGDERSEEKNEKIRKDGRYRIEWIWRYWIAVNHTEMNQVICTK